LFGRLELFKTLKRKKENLERKRIGNEKDKSKWQIGSKLKTLFALLSQTQRPEPKGKPIARTG